MRTGGFWVKMKLRKLGIGFFLAFSTELSCIWKLMVCPSTARAVDWLLRSTLCGAEKDGIKGKQPDVRSEPSVLHLFLCWNLPVISQLLNGSKFIIAYSSLGLSFYLSVFQLIWGGWFWATSLVSSYLWSSKIVFSLWMQQPEPTSYGLFLLPMGNNSVVSDTCQGVGCCLQNLVLGHFLNPSGKNSSEDWFHLLCHCLSMEQSLTLPFCLMFLWSVSLFHNSSSSQFLSCPLRNSGVHTSAWSCLSRDP